MRATEELARLGAELRRRREGAGLSLTDLASKAGLSQNHVGGIERGQRDPSVSTLLALARGLGCHAADLLGGTPELSAAAVEAVRLFDGAPVDVQDVTLQTLRKLGKRTAGKIQSVYRGPKKGKPVICTHESGGEHERDDLYRCIDCGDLFEGEFTEDCPDE